MAVVRTSLSEKGILSLYATPRAPVARHINGIANTTVRLAKRYVGKKTRALQKSIEKSKMYITPSGLLINVGSGLDYALVHHNGARRHLIRPNRAKQLRFKVGGKIVTTTLVNHPGHKANRYLTRALREAVLGAPDIR